MTDESIRVHWGHSTTDAGLLVRLGAGVAE